MSPTQTHQPTQTNQPTAHDLLVFKVANRLCDRFDLGSGNHLVGVIGDPDAKTNRDAVITWVYGYISPNGNDDPRSWYSWLSFELFRIIREQDCE